MPIGKNEREKRTKKKETCEASIRVKACVMLVKDFSIDAGMGRYGANV